MSHDTTFGKINLILQLVIRKVSLASALPLIPLLLVACATNPSNATPIPPTETIPPTEAIPTAEATTTPTEEPANYIQRVFKLPADVAVVNETGLTTVEALREIEGLAEKIAFNWPEHFQVAPDSEPVTLVLKVDPHGRAYFEITTGSVVHISPDVKDEEGEFPVYPAKDHPVIFVSKEELVPASAIAGTHFVSWDVAGANEVVYYTITDYDPETGQVTIKAGMTAVQGSPAANGDEVYNKTRAELGISQRQWDEMIEKWQAEQEEQEDNFVIDHSYTLDILGDRLSWVWLY